MNIDKRTPKTLKTEIGYLRREIANLNQKLKAARDEARKAKAALNTIQADSKPEKLWRGWGPDRIV